jgi:hypothetical protein
LLSDESGGFHLVEAGLRVAQDRFTEINDGIGLTINRLANRALQFILAAHSRPYFQSHSLASIRANPSRRNGRPK